MTTTRKLLHLLCPIGKLPIIMHRLYSFYWFKLEALTETEVNAKKGFDTSCLTSQTPGTDDDQIDPIPVKRERRI